jgi:putative CocE/NonD family hydrolase
MTLAGNEVPHRSPGTASSLELLLTRNLRVAMRDGVHLSTDVYRDPRRRQSPTLLVRTPYGKTGGGGVGSTLFPILDVVERGFALVVQDSRGCGVSEGRFEPFVVERSDGHDAIEWVASQPWSSGEVAVCGSSYMGVTALQATVDAPAALKACLAYITCPNFAETWVHSGGAFELGFNLRWSMAQGANRLVRCSDDAAAAAAAAETQAYSADPIGYAKRSFDVPNLLGAMTGFVPWWTRWTEPGDDDYWQSLDVTAAAEAGRVRVPVFQVAGWFDAFLKGQLSLHRALTEGRKARVGRHRIIVGPWSHESYLGQLSLASAGSRAFGPTAAGGPAGLGRVMLDWLALQFNGDGEREVAPVRYFEMGPNRWHEVTSWPPPADTERWYLASDGAAATLDGSGRLEPKPPTTAGQDTYLYDPADPAPTVGGRHLCYNPPAGVQDQRGLEKRPDVLVYTSQPLAAALTLRGPVRLELWVTSSAQTVDFFATLVDVTTEGRSDNVADGSLRLPVDVGLSGGVPQPHRIVIDLWDTAYVFPAGHRIRLLVTSSNFPRFDRNRGLPPGEEPTEAVTTTQGVTHSREHPSALALSVVP